MSRDTRRRQFRKAPARGVGIVTAIFLLVVLAGLSVALLTLFTTQQASASLDEQGARAYQAARAGVEWGVYQQLQLSNCASSTSLILPAATLSAFTVTVVCEMRGSATPQLTRYVITATACNQPVSGVCQSDSAPDNADYVARTMKVEI